MDHGMDRGPWGLHEVVLLGVRMIAMIRIRASEGSDVDAHHEGYDAYDGYDGLSRMMVLMILAVIGVEHASVAALARGRARLEPFFYIVHHKITFQTLQHDSHPLPPIR